jgi:pimeloyl-ACP methyl ester carboxylesterase
VSRLPPLLTESYLIPSVEPGIELYVRNKRPAALRRFTSARTVLYVHGSTFPAETTFDLSLDGLSWMDTIAGHGYDVYLMDVRGYGRSTRPGAMDEEPERSAPIVHTDVAVRDFGSVVDHILERRGISRLALLGWSWGGLIAAAFTAQNNDKVERLALYAPLWLREPTAPLEAEEKLGAWRRITSGMTLERWLKGVPPARQADIIPPGWFETFWSANLEADVAGSRETPPVVRAPNGVLENGRRYWRVGNPYYDPGEIRVPVLLVHPEWDVDVPASVLEALFARLAGTTTKRLVTVAEGTHFVMMEKNRLELFREIQKFLDEP